MDVTGVIAELRSERESLERLIRQLERACFLGGGTAATAADAVGEIKKRVETQGDVLGTRKQRGGRIIAMPRTSSRLLAG
jgi:hypothetical protein